MNISNKITYHNSIYNALILDVDSTAKIYQLYIPALHTSLEHVYASYYKEKNKENSIYRKYFPWATSTIEDLKAGDVAYIGFINNNISNILIIGKDTSPQSNSEGAGAGGGDVIINSTDILSLTMPIIMHNEVGLSVSAWPDNIPDSKYGTINGNDKGAWSIGLIQCRAMNAFNLCVDIAKKIPDWKSFFSNKDTYLVTYIDQKVQGKTLSSTGSNYVTNLKLTSDSSDYKGVYKLLTSAQGKQVQKETASAYTITSINKLQNEFGLTNPALIIFCADIMNQYGHYVNNSDKYYYVRGCMNKAKEYNNDTSKNTMQQLEAFYAWWKSKTTNYAQRRDTVISYIRQLETQGKLYTSKDLTELGPAYTSKYVPDFGEYYWPTPLSTGINCYWGEKSMKIPYSFKYNTSQKVMGYSSMNRFHYGTDFGPKKAGVDGDPVIAVGSGTVKYVSGNTGSQGNCIGIKMDKNKDHYFVYMHLCKKPTLKVGDKVKAGDVVGYMGTTGNSTGTHLHLGLHIGAVWPNPSSTSNKIDPLPYLGKQANA